MRARASLVAEADGSGGTRLVRLRGEPPLLLRHSYGGSGSAAVVHLVGGAAGPLGGDHLRLDIEIGPDAAVCLHTAAASVVLPARSGARSQLAVAATVAAGGLLHWLPEQTVAAAGCRHTTLATVELGNGAELLWRDELICGRANEPSGDATITTSVTYAGQPLLRQTLRVGPDAPGWSGPAVLGGATATGSLLHVHPGTPPPPTAILAPTAVRMPLSGPASLTTATAPDAHTLRGHLAAPALPSADR
jgi:urease accessory protein